MKTFGVDINVGWNFKVEAEGAEEAIEKARAMATEDNTSNQHYGAYVSSGPCEGSVE